MSIKGTQALILAPTRELAQQIQKVVIALGDYMSIECHACVGGTNVREDMAKLQEGVHVVVGTPGRVFDMINRRAFRTDHIKIFCLDEADEMLSRGFKDQIYEGLLYLLIHSMVSHKLEQCSNFSPRTRKSFCFLLPCLVMCWRSRRNSCVILSGFLSRETSWLLKVSSSFISRLRRRSGNWTPCVICTRPLPSRRLSFFATPGGRLTGWQRRCTPVNSLFRLW